MKTSNILLIIFLVVTLILTAWLVGTARYYLDITEATYVEGSGVTVTESRQVGEFNKLRVQGKFDVTIRQGTPQSVQLNTDENFAPEVITELDGKELVVRMRNKVRERKHIKVEITMENITGLNFSAGAIFNTPEEIKGDQLDFHSYAGSDGEIKLNYNKVFCNSYAGSAVRMAGTANEIKIESSAGSDIRAGDLKVKKCVAEGTAGSNIVIHVTEELTADLKAGASLNYYGNPSKTNFTTMAGGSVNRKN